MIYRQGDILLSPIKKLPENIKQKKSLVLVEGEATGHCHQFLDFDLVACYELDQQQYVEVFEQAPLVHEEHDTLQIPKGKYEVIRQREVSLLEEIRKVMD